MLSLSTWNTLFEGKYGSQELNILYSDDYLISYLKSRDQDNVLLQVYKVFAVYGDVEIFAETLPNQCIVYEKHLDIGEKNTYKFLLLNTEIQYVDSTSLSNSIEKKILELNKTTSSIISIIKSYNIKLVSLKMLPENQKNYFFSDPVIVQILTNSPQTIDFSQVTTKDKLLIGKKNNVPINISLDSLRSILVTNGQLDERLFAQKLLCELYLLSSKKVIIFDTSGVFKSLSYPQQHEDVLSEFDPKMGAFGFPSKFIDYFDIKIPLSTISKKAFTNLFKLTDVSEKVLEKCDFTNLENIDQLIKQVEDMKVTEEVTAFEKQRLISKLIILNKKYSKYFGKIDVSEIFHSKYKHLGSSKILKVDVEDPFYAYYVYAILKQISLELKEEVLIVFPEQVKLFNSMFVGNEVFDLINQNPKINYCLSVPYINDLNNKDLADIKLEVINGNDAVIKYPQRDPIRLLLRPTLSSSNIKLKKSEFI